MSGRSTGMVLLGIVAVIGLGLSGYMFVNYQFLSPITPGNNSELILVGIWEDIDKNTDYPPWNTNDQWLLEFSNSPINDSNYFSLDNGNTRFIFLQAGYYKISLAILLSNLDASDTYVVRLLRNNSTDSWLDRISLSDNPGSLAYHVHTSVYVYSNGVDDFKISCNSISDVSFTLAANTFNQLTIEYVLQ